ncbi:MaoC family dehydratase [Paracoccaceae bacterium]|nr:MaoC family dehydratase [Paracoccaceae bacterium]
MLKVRYPQDLKKFENYDLGCSDWFLIDQELINAFAKLSGDDQWIHIDSDRALNEMPDGKTIAHGLLTLCISPTLGKNKIHIENLKQTLNYGIDKVRFISPVKAGSFIRLRSKIAQVTLRDDDTVLVRFERTIEIKGIEKLAMYAETLSLMYRGETVS